MLFRVNIYVLVTSKCNLRCNYCYEGHEKTNKDMKLDTAEKTVDFIIDKFNKDKSGKPLTVIFHGGEPLLNFEIIKYIASSILKKIPKDKVRFDMTTNGTVMNDEIREFIKENIANISFSIDGSKYSHDLNRVFSNGNGSYDTATKNAKLLINEGINVFARMTFNSKTVEYLSDGVKSVLEMGFKYIVPVTDFYDNYWEKEHIEILKNQINQLIDLKKNYPESRISLIELNILTQKTGDCFGGLCSFSIDEVGKIYPCAFSFGKEEFVIGHINDGFISEDKLNSLVKIYTDENKVCMGCTRYENCIGVRCKILNKLVTGDYNSPPAIICASQKVKVDTIGKLVKLQC